MSLVAEKISLALASRPILSDVTVQLNEGEIVGLIGRNGVGKTSLFKTIMHQYVPETGQVHIDGVDVTQDPSHYPDVFYLDDQRLYFAHENLRFAAKMAQLMYPHFDGQRFINLLAANKLVDRQRYRQLSRGLKAYVRVSLAIASNAPYILLDEPFEGLDVIVREQILHLIVKEVADAKRSFFLASHDLDELDGLSDRVYMLTEGRITGDFDLEALREHAQKMQLVFKDNQVPDILASGQLISHRGRVFEVLFTDYTDAIDAALRATQPLLMEPMSLTLTDLFKLNAEEEK